MTPWKKGKDALSRVFERGAIRAQDFIASIEKHPPGRVAGTAVFMSSAHRGVPRALLPTSKHNRVLREHVILMTVQATDEPDVSEDDRLRVKELGEGFHSVVARWRIALLQRMNTNSLHASMFFKIHANRVVELGAQVAL
jgi:KUP system potassium uptake protein